MLSNEEKKEMLFDAHNPARKEMFAKARRAGVNSLHSPDEYIKFLRGIQKVFGPFKYGRGKSTTCKNLI